MYKSVWHDMGVFLREKAELVMAVVLIAAAILVAPRSAEYVMSMKAKTAATVVVIDPGHGGSQLRE